MGLIDGHGRVSLIRGFYVLFVILVMNQTQIYVRSKPTIPWVQRSGQFTWFYPTLNSLMEESSNSPHEFEVSSTFISEDNLKKQEKSLEKLKSLSFIEEHLPTQYNEEAIRNSIQKILASIQLFKGENYRILMIRNNMLVISVKSWPFGWRHYPFSLHFEEIVSQQDRNTFQLYFPSLNSHRSMEEIALRISLGKNEKDESFQLTSEIFHHRKLLSAFPKTLFQPFIYHFQKLLQEQLQIYEIRKQQSSKYQRESNSAEKKRQEIERDKIIHPEKYKSKSPSVKRLGSGSSGGNGSGRYTPSAATQARRQVRRGG